MDLTLQALLDELARDGGNVAGMLAGEGAPTREALNALETEALAAFDTIRGGAKTAEDATALEQLSDVIGALRARGGEMDAAEQASQARIAELTRVVHGETEQTGQQEQPAETTEDVGDAPPPVETAPASVPPAASAPAESTPTIGEVTLTPVPIAASGSTVTGAVARRTRLDLATVSARAPKTVAPADMGPRLADVLTAAADIPNVPVGAGFDSLLALAAAANAKSLAMVKGGPGVRYQSGLASLDRRFPAELTCHMDDGDTAVMDYAASEHRLAGGSLVAAGGWCAPSEIIYTLCELEAADELFSLPEVTTTRGGYRWTTDFDFCDILGAPAFFTQTEAQAEAATLKPCFEIPCPDFQECRLDAIGYCLTAGILTSRGYPEVIARWLRGALVAHLHRMSLERLTRVIAGSTDLGTLGAGCGGATSSVLDHIELQAEAIRSRQRMSRGTTIEVLAPTWLRSVMRADLGRRNGFDDALGVTDAQLSAYLGLRGVTVQWLSDYQPFEDCDTNTPLRTTWPTTVQLVMYPAGKWIAGVSDIIRLDNVYDSTLFRTNRYTAIFFEEGLCVMGRCGDSRVFTVPICPTGETGAQTTCACPLP
jgi:hypothetical protein